MHEGSTEYFLLELGGVLDDIVLALDADGTLTRARAISALNYGQERTQRSLIVGGVRPQVFARKVTLADDSGDDDVSLLPYRTLMVLSVESSTGQIYPSVYSRKRARESGYIVERRASTTGGNYLPSLRWWGYDRPSTVYAWIVESPPKLSYGVGAAYANTSITLATTPTIGPTVENDDYYNGAEVAIESGSYIGQVREISDYAGSTRIATVAAWTNNPTGATDYYSILSPLPRVAWDAMVLEAALRIVQVDARWWDQHGVALAHMRRNKEAAFQDALRSLCNPVSGAAVEPRQAVNWIS